MNNKIQPHLEQNAYGDDARAPLKRSVSSARLQEEQEAEAARAMRNIYDQAQTAFVRSQSAPQSVLSAIDDNGE